MNNATVAKNFVKYNTQGIHNKTGKGSNMYFEGNKLYSYGTHWILAEYDIKRGLFIVNDAPYSNSTSKHIGHTWSATHNEKHYTGNFSRMSSWSGLNSSELDFKEAIINAKCELSVAQDKIKRVRTEHMRNMWQHTIDTQKERIKYAKKYLKQQ